MSVIVRWLGEGDTNGDYLPSSSLVYFGTQKFLGWLGQNDTNRDWMSAASLVYWGTKLGVGWLGEHDTALDWMAITSLVYWAMTGQPASNPPGFVPSGPGGPILNNGYPGMTWMKNVYVLPRDFWADSLSNPYVGQLWPVPNTGGAASGQTFPF